jgi:hypothetical protein
VLACIEKYEPGAFEEWCMDVGYDTDSRKAEGIYNAVKDQYMHVAMLFSDTELEELQEIS